MNEDTIFVFGSNLRGNHGAGAAITARTRYGAIPGVGVGPMNRAYAIPTKDWNVNTLPRPIVMQYIGQFKHYARLHWVHKTKSAFMVTRVGCGLAGFKDQEIAPLFADAPPNCTFDVKWKTWLLDMHDYWGGYPE